MRSDSSSWVAAAGFCSCSCGASVVRVSDVSFSSSPSTCPPLVFRLPPLSRLAPFVFCTSPPPFANPLIHLLTHPPVAQKTFLHLRTLANRHGSSLTCIAVSHSSPQATKKWVDLLGGAWSVRVVVDEDRSLYAAWGLGLAGVWHLFNPTTQVQGWKEKGWLGDKVAGAIQRGRGVEESEREDDDGPTTVMGNKWQEAGAFAVDGTGTVVWGGKALRADDVMDLDYGARILLA